MAKAAEQIVTAFGVPKGVKDRVPEGTPVTNYSNTNANQQTVKHEVFNCKYEDIQDRLAAVEELYKVFATQSLYRPTQDDFVFICYYKG